MQFVVLTAIDEATYLTKNDIADFLVEHMGVFNHSKFEILRALDFALSKYPHQGGFVILAKENEKIRGAVVICKTGMEVFMPENVLMYLAVHHDSRGLGLGTRLLKETLKMANGDIALHVEPQNPARALFEKVGFKYSYFEMRISN